MNAAIDHVPLTTPQYYARALIDNVARSNGLTCEQVLGRDRHKRFVVARHAAIRAVCEANPHWSYPAVGRLFGIDHTSVMHALDRTGGRTPRLRKPCGRITNAGTQNKDGGQGEVNIVDVR